MVLSRLNTLFRQFGPLAGAGYLIAEGARKLVDPNSGLSYAQSGEDRFITAILGQRSGFYVDVGCNHPIQHSNTFALYKSGWTGLVVDANPDLIALHRSRRRRDKQVCAVVSSIDGEVEFTEFDDTNLSSLDPEHVRYWKATRPVKRVRKAAAVQLTTLLEQHGAPSRFDLLSVDVERHDLEVLRSLDFERYRPELIVVEMRKLDLAEVESNPIYQLLTGTGYGLIGYAINNGYFLDLRAPAHRQP